MSDKQEKKSKYQELYDKRISYALDPIFAPVTYGDDRCVTRTRRGIHCADEMNLQPNLVYCACKICNYQWIMDKSRYINGLAKIEKRPNPTLLKNIGVGGTGLWICNLSSTIYDKQTNGKNARLHYQNLPADVTTYYSYDAVNGKFFSNKYKQYNVLAHDASYHSKHSLEKLENGMVHTYDFYPLTGGTGETGELTPGIKDIYYKRDTYNNILGIIGDLDSHYLGPIIPVYEQPDPPNKYDDIDYNKGTFSTNIEPFCGGGTGSSITLKHSCHPFYYHEEYSTINHYINPFRRFGGHPMCCPNCGRVYFMAKWLEPNDRPSSLEGATDDPNCPYRDKTTIDYHERDCFDNLPCDFVDEPDGVNIGPVKDYLKWTEENRLIKIINFNYPYENWFAEDIIFKQFVDIIPFDSNGTVLIDHFTRITINPFRLPLPTIELIGKEIKTGYIWVLKPTAERKAVSTKDGIGPGGGHLLETGIVVRDFQMMKSHFNKIHDTNE